MGFRLAVPSDIPRLHLKRCLKNHRLKPKLLYYKTAQTLPQADFAFIRSGYFFSRSFFESHPECRGLIMLGSGLDHVDINSARDFGIKVSATPGANAQSAAELTMALAILCLRNLSEASIRLRAGEWKRWHFRGSELSGRIFGVVGIGRVGTRVAKLARAFGAIVLATDPYLSADEIRRRGGIKVSLNELLRQSDIISLHCPLNSETQNIMTKQRLRRMKKPSVFVNAARGGLVDERALLTALDRNIRAAALDVFKDEPPAKQHPFLQHARIFCVPHLGAQTHEAQSRCVEQAIEQLKLWQKPLKKKLSSSAKPRKARKRS